MVGLLCTMGKESSFENKRENMNYSYGQLINPERSPWTTYFSKNEARKTLAYNLTKADGNYYGNKGGAETFSNFIYGFEGSNPPGKRTKQNSAENLTWGDGWKYRGGGYLRGNITYLTLGAWFYEQPGIINSVEYSVPEEAPWEIGIALKNQDGNGVGSQFDDDTVREMPHMIKVSMKFTPIHEFRPEIMDISTNKNINNTDNPLKDENNYGKQRYLSLSVGENNYNLIKQFPNQPPNIQLQDGTTVPLQSVVNENTLLSTPIPPNPDLAVGNQDNLVIF